MKDLMYIYDKTSPYSKHELGEIQTNFNQNFVIDGTKDSAKVIVFNFEEREVEPYSILRHQATDTWWIVSHDKVERVVNRLDSGEIEYWYKHNLELQGAIELLNARDLTDCGFNSNTYTVEEVFKRLVKLSNFEFTFALNPNNRNVIDYDKIVDYVKTFENYTLLSALREFFDAYNCSIKLHFIESNNTIIGAIFDLISKTGNTTRETLDESAFNQIQEVKTIDKDSFGTSVISNAQNVISTKTKTFPSTGAVKISGTAHTINGGLGTGVIRLPSNIYKVNYVDMYRKTPISIYRYGSGNATLQYHTKYLPYDDKSVQDTYNEIKDYFEDLGDTDFSSSVTIEDLKYKYFVRFYYTDEYNALDSNNQGFRSNYPIPIRYLQSDQTWNTKRQTVLTNKELKDSAYNKDDAFCFERGKDVIDGITFFGSEGAGLNKAYFEKTDETALHGYNNNFLFVGDVEVGSSVTIRNRQEYYLPEIGFIVNYIPMSDIKIKLDNSGTSKDSKIYNQNGKLTDSVALSKSLLSYSKEIESDNITKYARYFVGYTKTEIETIRIDNTPQVGDLVALNNDTYVINNVSKTFYPNESPNLGTTIEYYVDCEFTLSKQIAVKSLMVNPNQNIRDYGIPQNFNVKRKQLYRDFYELTHTQESSLSSGRLPLDRVLNVKNYYEPYQEHIGVMKLTFNGAYGGTPTDTWYYQLESTTFVMKKSIYEVIDFKDNNIIGYGNQNVWSGFDITRLLTNAYDLTNTPISYVDINGEVKGIEIYFSTNEQITTIYNEYKTSTGQDFSDSNFNAFYSCFIPSDIYTRASDNSKHDFKVEELDYEKDATEVPVFEYCCQIDDSYDVLIGSNILDTYTQDLAYLYTYALVDKGKYNDNNYGLIEVSKPTVDVNNIATINNAVKLEISNGKLGIKLYNSMSYNVNTKTETSLGTQQSIPTNKDLVIVRQRILADDLQYDVIGDLYSTTVYSTLPTVTQYMLNKYAVKNDDKYYLCVPNPTSSDELYDLTVHNYSEMVAIEENPQNYGNRYVGKYGTFKYPSGTYTEIASTEITKETTGIPTNPINNGNYIVINDSQSPEFIWYYGYGIKVTLLSSAYYASGDATFYILNDQYLGMVTTGQSMIIYSTNVRDLSKIVCRHGGLHNRPFLPKFKVEVVDSSGNVISTYRAHTFSCPSLEEGETYTMTDGDQHAQSTIDFRYFKYPATYMPYIWKYVNGNWQQRVSQVTNNQIFELRNSYRYYQWQDNGSITGTLVDYTNSIGTDNIVIAKRDDNLSGFSVITTISNNKKAVYESLQYYFLMSGLRWVLDGSAFKWQEEGNADGLYFTYNNTLYQYNASSQHFNQISGFEINRDDLMFIVRNMEDATINDNELKLSINHYDTD